MNKQLRVLMIEDSEDDAILIQRELRRHQYELVCERVDNVEDMHRALDRDSWDVILSDYTMPNFGAPQALKVMQQRGLDLPFIIVSGTVGEEAAVIAMKAGAHDFFAKHQLARLVPVIERELHETEERRKRRQAEAELQQLYNATSYLFKADNLLTLGNQIVEAVIREFKQADCGLMLVNHQQKRMIRLTRTGIYDIHPEIPLYLEGNGLVPAAVRTGEIIYVPDVTQSTLYVNADPRTRSELTIPLKVNQKVVAVLDLQSTNLNAFTEQDQRILSAFAERAAAAIEIMQLYEELNQHAAQLEWRVEQRTFELQRTKEQLEAILASTSDPIVIINSTCVIQQANPAFVKQFQYTLDELPHQSLLPLLVPETIPVFEATCQQVLLTGAATRIDVICRVKDHTQFDAEFAITPMAGPQREELCLLCSIRDITNRKKAEAALRSALDHEKELNELKSRFVSIVSHEFRTPLAAIRAASDTLLRYREYLTEQQKQERIIKIQTQIHRLVILLDEILVLGSIQNFSTKPKLLPVDITLLCQEILTECRTIADNHLFEFTVIGQPITNLLLDTNLIQQAVNNLLSNAIKYSATGSTIWLNLIFEPPNIKIQVRDQGIGIPEADLKLLFEAFHRATNVKNIPGTGLGLTIVKQAVEAHGGTIHVDSQLNVGSIFTLLLPISDHPPASEDSDQ